MKSKTRRYIPGIGLLVFILLLLGGIGLYLHGRPAPVPIRQTLHQGVEYQRIVRVVPRPVVIHVLKINMKTKGLRVFITPPDDSGGEQPLRARTTSQFLEEFDLDIAVNGDGFTPWWSHSPADYYPHAGDPVPPREIGRAHV